MSFTNLLSNEQMNLRLVSCSKRITLWKSITLLDSLGSSPNLFKVNDFNTRLSLKNWDHKRALFSILFNSLPL